MSTAATMPLSCADERESTLPSLRTAASSNRQRRMVRSPTSMEFDVVREQDDLFYLQHGQGAGYSSKRMVSRVAAGNRAETDSIAESDVDTAVLPLRTPARSNLYLSFSPLPSPPAEDAMDIAAPLGERLSQRDVYDTAPPPGYKRLNKVRSSRRHTWANARTEMEQPHSYVDCLPSRVFRPRHLLPTTLQEPLFQQLPVQFLGDGFSGDEAKARPRRIRKRAKSDSSSSVGSSSKRKKKADVSPILGSLDIVSLSQEERAIDMAAAAGAAFAAAKAASRTNTIMEIIPLRPMQHVPPAIIWDFDDTQTPVTKTEVDNANMGDDVVVIPSSCNENGQVIEIINDEVAVHYSELPPLRQARKRKRSPTCLSLVALENLYSDRSVLL